jgi:hypothetical protein
MKIEVWYSFQEKNSWAKYPSHQIDGMKVSAAYQPVPIPTIIKFILMGYKPVPVLADGKTNNVGNGFIENDSEYNLETNPNRKPTKVIYDNPRYWFSSNEQDSSWKIDDKKLNKHSSRFINISTTLGKTIFVEPQSKLCYWLIVFDIDDLTFQAGLQEWIDNDIANRTVVIRTRKGRHIHLLVPLAKEMPKMELLSTKNGGKIVAEIKTNWSSSTCVLPGSHHRNDPNFTYKMVQERDTIGTDDIKLAYILS